MVARFGEDCDCAARPQLAGWWGERAPRGGKLLGKPVGRHQPHRAGLARGLVGVAQAVGLEVWPATLRAGRSNWTDIEPVALDGDLIFRGGSADLRLRRLRLRVELRHDPRLTNPQR